MIAQTTQQASQQLPFAPHLIKPDAPVVHHQLLKGHVHRPCLPDFANEPQRHRTVLAHTVPFVPNLQALRLAIIGKAPNPSIIDSMVLERKRVEEVLTIHDPMPTVGAPMRFKCPVVYFIGLGVEQAGVHSGRSSLLSNYGSLIRPPQGQFLAVR
jgi:hypothetical protein